MINIGLAEANKKNARRDERRRISGVFERASGVCEIHKRYGL